MPGRSRLPKILLNLHSQGQSGVFRAQKASLQKQLVLDKGTIAFVESNQPQEHLARIMIDMGYLQQSDLSEVIAQMKTGKNSEEAIYTVNNSEPETVRNAVREQVMTVLSSLLSWDNFNMKFFPGDNLIKNRTRMGFSVPEMLVFSARRAAGNHLVSVFSDFSQGTIFPGRDMADLRTELPLNDVEAYAYVRMHDGISIQELIPLISGKNAVPEEVLQGLYLLGLIETGTSLETPDPEPSDSASANSFSILIEDMLTRFKSADLYEILSVGKDAGSEDIQEAYHSLAKKFHPDRFQSRQYSGSLRNQVQQVFTYINRAYAILKDPDLRAKYDEEKRKKESEVEAAIKNKASAATEEDEAVEALFRKGQRSLLQQEFEKAAKELKSCVYLRPEKAQYNHFLGLAECEIPTLYKSAESRFLKAIELEPMSIESRIALTKLYLKVRLPRKASLELDELMRWDPDNPEAKKLRKELRGA